ncbi:response regulator [Edaphobacter modestus]|uniref:LuxR family two component transcriptional regulator n=1 Tax=Edaphobacter modestus TaxID=388466 RepID=A0A4Q7YF45_9BACT|nr:response regulator transcription factor [Edaphobacter modestus]RZU35203.1 LuxR family two component transcriptional regulator [Edaphobacter modestus]
MPTRIRILIADDHPTIRKGLIATLEPEPDMEIVGAAPTRQAAIAMWQETRPDITLMDLALEGCDGGVDAIRQIRKESPTAKIIVFSAVTGDEDVFQALRYGAVTFLTKETPDEELVQTIRDVHAGGRPIPPEIARKLADRLTQSSLTTREVEVLSLVARGYRNKEVAAALSISEETVQGHMKHILSKLGVNDRTSAVVVAAQRGIIRLR